MVAPNTQYIPLAMQLAGMVLVYIMYVWLSSYSTRLSVHVWLQLGHAIFMTLNQLHTRVKDVHGMYI